MTSQKDSVGTFIFKPIQANFLYDRDPVGKMNPYCKFKLGRHKGKSSVAKHEGSHPTWTDVIILKRKHKEHFAKVKVKDKDRISLNPNLGEVKIDLEEVITKGRVIQTYTLKKKDKVSGDLLIAIEYVPINI